MSNRKEGARNGTFCALVPPLPLSEQSKVISIPCLPYVARYLEKQYPAGYRLSESDALGELIYQLLRRPNTKTRNDAFLGRYSETFTVHITQARLADRGLGKINSWLVVRVNSFLEAQIRDKMYDFVDTCCKYKILKKAAAIREFMQSNGFSEQDIAYETLIKSYQRHVSQCKEKQQVK